MGIMKIFALLFMFSTFLFANDTKISLAILDHQHQTFIISNEQMDHLLVAFRHCTNDDQCLKELHEAVLDDNALAILPIEEFCMEYVCTFDTILYNLAMPFVLSIMCEVSGFLLGGLDDKTPPSALGTRIAGALVIWLVAGILYSQIPKKQKKDKEKLKDEMQKLLQKSDKMITTLAKISEVKINNINILNITRNCNDFTLKVSSSVIDNLKKLAIFPIVFSEAINEERL